MGTTTAVDATGLIKTFDTVRAVAGIDLDVGQGEIFGVLGPNGAGKTTMLRMLATLRATVPTAGHHGPARHRRRRQAPEGRRRPGQPRTHAYPRPHGLQVLGP